MKFLNTVALKGSSVKPNLGRPFLKKIYLTFAFCQGGFAGICGRVSWLYRGIVRPVLFAQDSEAIHRRTLRGLGRLGRSPGLCQMARLLYGAPPLPVDLFGLKFPNPLGVAAGLDKFGEAVPAWAALGFGFCELGGVTWRPQPGNPVPRLFRAIPDRALVNSMGFNNPGATALAETLDQWKKSGRWPGHPVGINLGKSKITPLENAAEDYANSFRALRGHADFFVVNVSSPNTPNLRQLQDKTALDEILAALQEINPAPAKPILIKVAPDLSFEALDEILQLALARKLAGIVATNTTITRPATTDTALKQIYDQPGGLSGRPLAQRSTEVIRHLYGQGKGTMPIVGVGGIFNAADAWEKITAGASLLQIYTGLIYQGPSVTREIVSGLNEQLSQHGFRKLREAIGSTSKNRSPG